MVFAHYLIISIASTRSISDWIFQRDIQAANTVLNVLLSRSVYTLVFFFFIPKGWNWDYVKTVTKPLMFFPHFFSIIPHLKFLYHQYLSWNHKLLSTTVTHFDVQKKKEGKIGSFSFKLHFNNTWGHPWVSAFSFHQDDPGSRQWKSLSQRLYSNIFPLLVLIKLPGISLKSRESERAQDVPGGTTVIQTRCPAPHPSSLQLVIHCIQMDSPGLQPGWRWIHPQASVPALASSLVNLWIQDGGPFIA